MRPLIPARDGQPLRYLISGAACAVANNLLLIVGARAGIDTFGLMMLSFGIIGSAGYVVHAHFTFQRSPGWSSYARFMLGVALGIPIAYAVFTLLCDIIHVPMWAAAPIGTLALIVYNYFSARLAIMRRLLS